MHKTVVDNEPQFRLMIYFLCYETKAAPIIQSNVGKIWGQFRDNFLFKIE